jgi:hypothetical protein
MLTAEAIYIYVYTHSLELSADEVKLKKKAYNKMIT